MPSPIKKHQHLLVYLLVATLFACGGGGSAPAGKKENSASKLKQYFFTGMNGSGDAELWATDGTSIGTELLNNINASGSSNPRSFTKLGRDTFFVADDGIHGKELWKTDGTDAGTILVKDINKYGEDGPVALTVVGNLLFFNAVGNESPEDVGLWKTDGTTKGTVKVKLIYPRSLAVVGEILFFEAGNEIWSSDGTEQGTIRLMTAGSNANPTNLTVFDDTLFFSATADDEFDKRLWKSNGTVAGTMPVTDFGRQPGYDGLRVNELAVVGDTLFISANGGLWKSDGTEQGTVLVKNILVASGSVPHFLRAINDTLLFAAEEGGGDVELWKSDGTEAGTVVVKDINKSGSSSPKYMEVVGSFLFFSADDGLAGRELWRSDGTEEGTVLVKDIEVGLGSSDPKVLAQYTSQLIWSVSIDEDYITDTGSVLIGAYTANSGLELWESDGTKEGTIIVKDINPGMGDGVYEP